MLLMSEVLQGVGCRGYRDVVDREEDQLNLVHFGVVVQHLEKVLNRLNLRSKRSLKGSTYY